MPRRRSHLDDLEDESLFLFREVVATCERPVLLYSIGKDSSVLLHLARKAFFPGSLPFPLLHVDTSYKFPEMLEFRDRLCAELGVELIVARNEAALAEGANPWDLGTTRCCQLLKTQALLDALGEGGWDAAFGGARRDEEKSRAKERMVSFRDAHGQWDPRRQRPELWKLFNMDRGPGETLRVFPLSNWTEGDVWAYIEREEIPIVPLYRSAGRLMVERDGRLLPPHPDLPLEEGEEARSVPCRFRTLGCWPCTGAVPSEAVSLPEIREEVREARRSERTDRLIDHDQAASMERKKREGYF